MQSNTCSAGSATNKACKPCCALQCNFSHGKQCMQCRQRVVNAMQATQETTIITCKIASSLTIMYSTSLPAVCFHKDMGWHFNFALRVHCSCSPAPQSGLSHSRLALSIMQYSGGCSNMQGRIQKISRHARHSHCVQECILSSIQLVYPASQSHRRITVAASWHAMLFFCWSTHNSNMKLNPWPHSSASLLMSCFLFFFSGSTFLAERLHS